MPFSTDLQFSIHKKTPEPLEIKAFYQLDQDHFPFPWTHKMWSDTLYNIEEHLLLSLSSGDNLVGFSLFKVDHYEKLAHLYKILVKDNMRLLGLGNQLLEKSIDYLKQEQFISIVLEVEQNNLSAQKLYSKALFEIIHRKTKFYSNGQDALIMQRKLV
jgi:[ribosomal protein S18]-alanine N-acetyltransferase